MLKVADIEDIEDLRRREGIDDIELRQAVSQLKAGDLVKLTLVNRGKGNPGEFVVVRITSIKGRLFRGKIVSATEHARTPERQVGAVLVFQAAHIHSILKSVSARKN